MTDGVYYNENDPKIAAWLRCVAEEGHVPKGLVDERSIVDVERVDAKQAHFFAGIGGWPLALRYAGIPTDANVWTGSCPCQPFSTAGRRRGTKDARHLWPEWRRLIDIGRPVLLFGEQVASPAGRAWLASVQADLEALGYSVGAADLCAAGIGAPHLRQRLFFVAVAHGERRERERLQLRQRPSRSAVPQAGGSGEARGMGDTSSRGRRHSGAVPREKAEGHRRGQAARAVADEPEPSGAVDGPWSDVVWWPCGDGKLRPAQPGVEPLAHGVPGRLVKLRGYGNAIVPQLAAEFVLAALEVIGWPA